MSFVLSLKIMYLVELPFLRFILCVQQVSGVCVFNTYTYMFACAHILFIFFSAVSIAEEPNMLFLYRFCKWKRG